MKYITKKFDTLTQYSRYLNNKQENKLFANNTCVSKSYNKTGYSLTESYKDADDLLKYGDKENLKLIKAMILKQKLNGTGLAKKQQYYNDVVGYIPNVPNFVVGVPQNMINKRVVRYKNSKIVNIVYNPTVGVSVPAEDLRKVSVDVMNFISGLESKGYRVNLFTITSSYKKKETVSCIVRIKSSDEHTDLLKMVYPMVHPSFLRRHFLRFIEVTDEITDDGFVDTYGVPTKNKNEINEILKSANIKYDYYLNFYDIKENGIKF